MRAFNMSLGTVPGTYGAKCLKVDPPVKQELRGNRSGLSQQLLKRHE